jgi:hypothetical protein
MHASYFAHYRGATIKLWQAFRMRSLVRYDKLPPRTAAHLIRLLLGLTDGRFLGWTSFAIPALLTLCGGASLLWLDIPELYREGDYEPISDETLENTEER